MYHDSALSEHVSVSAPTANNEKLNIEWVFNSPEKKKALFESLDI